MKRTHGFALFAAVWIVMYVGDVLHHASSADRQLDLAFAITAIAFYRIEQLAERIPA